MAGAASAQSTNWLACHQLTSEHTGSVGDPNWLFAYVATMLFITIHLTKGD